jgi:5-methylcytosine-specific restriction endonuclease McrA
MSEISEATRRRVRERAGNRCEYCLSHQDYVLGRLQIDHIQPVAKGGSDDDDNLCLACELCNQYKWTKTHGRDPDTGREVALFHP